jgi:Mrp family chromosome partitioning ATPase
MTRLLGDLQRNFDVVIIDGPPLFIMDAQILASRVGGIVLVVRQGDTLTAVARSMLDQLNFMEANVFGAVLNCVPQKQTYYFDERIEDLGKKLSETSSASRAQIRRNGESEKEPGKSDETRMGQR